MLKLKLLINRGLFFQMGPAPDSHQTVGRDGVELEASGGQSCRGDHAARRRRRRAEFIPVFLSDVPALFETRRIPLDVALVQLSPPDRHGACTLGTSVDAT